jgi:drug/metabolite transporter (DMT)-like permease
MIESILTALFGTSIFSAGVILQKKGSVWMSWKERLNRRFVRSFLLWLAGILLSYAISTLFVGAASRNLSPQMISAITGWNVVLIVFLSGVFLKEKLQSTDIIYSGVIVSCIIIMSRFQGGGKPVVVGGGILYWLLLVPFVLLVPVFTKLTDKKRKTVLLSIFSGFLGGLTIVFMNILVKESGDSIQGILNNPLLYIYFFSGVLSVAAKQAAYRIGDVILITPLQTGFTMVYPLVCSYILFDSQVSSVQFVMVLMIVLSCWKLQKSRNS